MQNIIQGTLFPEIKIIYLNCMDVTVKINKKGKEETTVFQSQTTNH